MTGPGAGRPAELHADPAGDSARDPAGGSDRPRVAYIVSRFPKLTETFVLYEVLAVERCGIAVELFPIVREADTVAHPGADELGRRAHRLPLLGREAAAALLAAVRHRPRALGGAVATIVRHTAGSPRMLIRALAVVPWAAAVAARAAALGVSHVHCHFATHPAAAGLVVHRLTGLPFSFTAHGSDLSKDRHMLAAKVAEASFVVAVSEDGRRTILGETGGAHAERVVVVPTGTDTDVFAPPDTRAPAAPLRAVCVGTLHEVKGQVHLVRAAAMARARGVDLTVHLVGDGPDRSALADEARRLGIADGVTLHGPLPRDEVARLLRGAHLAVVPSVPSRDGRREGLPVALMEAMASGLPVVASRLSGIPELVEDGRTGLLVEPGDEQALADALVRLAGDPAEREALGRAARCRILEGFDRSRSAEVLAARFSSRVPA